MELGKYKKAMRPKKYLTRDFIVYQDPRYTSVIQGYGSLDTPPEGVEMRIDKQAGGVVQREGFALGTDLQEWLKKSFPEVQFDFATKNRLGKTYEYGLPYPKSKDSREERNLYQKVQNAVKYKKLDPTFEVGEYKAGVRKPSVSRGKPLKEYGGLTATQMDNARYENAAFEIDRSNKLGIVTDVEAVANKTGIQREALFKFIKQGKITAPADKKDLVIQYIKNAYNNNEPLENFKQENIRKYINHGVSAESGSKLGEKTLQDLVRTDVKRELPEIYKLIYNSTGGAIKRIPNVKKLKDLPVLDYEADPDAATREQMASTQKQANLKSKITILEGKLKLGQKDFQISQAMDQYVKNLNAEIKKNPALVLDNPKLMELATTTFDNNPKSLTYGQVLPNTRSVDKVIGDIEKGFFSTEHLIPKATKQGNIEFPTNKVIVPRTTNARLIRQAQSFFKNNPAEITSLDEFESFVNKSGFNVRINNKTIGPKIGSTIEDGKLRSYSNSIFNYGIDPNIVDNKITSLSPTEFSNIKTTMKQKIDNLKALQNNFKQNPQLFQVAEASFGDVCRVKKSTGGKISGESYDACIARNLSETIGDAGSADEAKRGKAMGKLMQMTRSAKTVGKGALRGLQSILIGTGPIEIPIALGLEVAAPIYNYFQGEKLETILGSAPLLGYALSKINPEKFSEEAIQKLIYESGLNEEEQKQAANLVAQLKRYTTMKDLFRQKESLPDYYQQLIDEGADPTSTTNMMEAKIAELDKLIKKNADEFGAEENKVTADQIRIIGKGISNAAEEAQFQKEKTFLHKYLYNPAADPMTVRDYIDRKKMSYLDRIFYGDDLGMSAGIRPELRTIPTPEIKDYYGDSMVPTPFAEGGVVERKGFADGPKIGRRGFLGLLAGIVASLKVGSFGGTGKKVTTQVAKKVIKDAPTGTPEWFAPLVDKVFKEGIDASQTMKTTEREIVKKLEVPSPNSDGALTDTYYLYQNTDTGEIKIDIDAPGLGANDGEFSLYFRPDRIDGITDDGIPMRSDGEFFVTEDRVVGRATSPDDYEIELEPIDTDLEGSASNWHKVEEFATGKTDKKAQAKQLEKKERIEAFPHEDLTDRYGDYDPPDPDDY
jgi:hypothetical protein